MHNHAEPDGCCAVPELGTNTQGAFRRVLWIALVLNGGMFVIEIVAGVGALSTALMADALDFFADAFNYALSLAVIARGPAWRAGAALVKGGCMLLFAVVIALHTAYALWSGTVPEPITMGVVGVLALAVNVMVAVLLMAYREGDANMRSVWLCTRNDAIGNVAVILAAVGVFGTASGWPDAMVAAIMVGLAGTASFSVIRQALGELREHRTAHA